MPRRTHPRGSKRKQVHAFLEALDGSLFCSCGKLSAHTEEEAWRLALGINKARPGGEMPQRVYSCNDDGQPPFHWTRKP